MKKIVLTFGLIAGAILTVVMWATLPFLDANSDHGYVIGYTTMVVAFLLIYFGARSYRDNVAGGTVSFGRAFAVGASIALVASVCYVASWEVMYFNVTPDFMEKYQAHVLEKARQGGEPEAVIAQKKAEMDKFAIQYRNPAFNAAVTLGEPLPVGLIIALVSAGVLSRRRKSSMPMGQLERSA
jgi:Protein of unknown function (DUF4199)